jgi:soluble lytic murein transglycosylase-like protein
VHVAKLVYLCAMERSSCHILIAGGALCALSPAAAAAANIYGYVGDDGAQHYSNVPDSSRYKLVLRNPEDYRLKPNPRHRLPANEDSQTTPPSESEARKDAETITAAAFDLQHPFGEIIRREAASNRLDPLLVAAVISVESNHNPGARSPKGAAGLMQLMPDTAKRYGISDPYSADSNIRAGTRYLRDLLNLFNGDVRLALAGYNAGENAVIRYGNRIPPYPETQDYVPKVLKKYDALRKTSRVEI